MAELEIKCQSAKDWRSYLRQHHKTVDAVWLIFYKKHTGIKWLTYQEAVREALCYGWIDGIRKRIDDDLYKQRFTPRRPGSIWSLVNKEMSNQLIKQRKMTKAGLLKIEEAKQNGNWQKAYSSQKKIPLPTDIKAALKKDTTAQTNFNNFAPSYQQDYIRWVESAKKLETRKRRIQEVVQAAHLNKKPGMT